VRCMGVHRQRLLTQQSTKVKDGMTRSQDWAGRRSMP
jgi:hypothetical protein